jgi:hypothetical protein
MSNNLNPLEGINTFMSLPPRRTENLATLMTLPPQYNPSCGWKSSARSAYQREQNIISLSTNEWFAWCDYCYDETSG